MLKKRVAIIVYPPPPPLLHPARPLSSSSLQGEDAPMLRPLKEELRGVDKFDVEKADRQYGRPTASLSLGVAAPFVVKTEAVGAASSAVPVAAAAK